MHSPFKVPGRHKFAIKTKTYQRTEPDYLQRLREYVRHYYSIKPLSLENATETAEEFEDLVGRNNGPYFSRTKRQ